MYKDAELKEKILNLDKEATEYVCNQYYKIVYTKALYFLKSEEEAEDFTQDFFVDFLTIIIKKYNSQRGSLETFITTKLLFNKLRDRLRRLQRHRLRFLPIVDEAEHHADEKNTETVSFDELITHITDDSIQQKLEKEEQIAIIRNVITGLDPLCQKILQLRYSLGLSPEKISEELSIPLGTVSSRRYRCIQELRRLLKREFER